MHPDEQLHTELLAAFRQYFEANQRPKAPNKCQIEYFYYFTHFFFPSYLHTYYSSQFQSFQSKNELLELPFLDLLLEVPLDLPPPLCANVRTIMNAIKSKMVNLKGAIIFVRW